MNKSDKKFKLRSMTGFGSGRALVGEVGASCEIRSVNHRGLDVRFRLDKEFIFLEAELLPICKKAFIRGRIDVYLSVNHEVKKIVNASFQSDAARTILKQMKELASIEKNITPDVSLGHLFSLPELFVFDNAFLAPELVVSVAKSALSSAINEALSARLFEGTNLAKVLARSTMAAAGFVTSLSKISRNEPAQMLEKLRERLFTLVKGYEFDETRLIQEVALLADKVDVSEEIDRLQAHFEHFTKLCENEGAVGRKLDFLCQEMFREANTIGSKSSSTACAHLIVDLKAEIERLREQVQNVE